MFSRMIARGAGILPVAALLLATAGGAGAEEKKLEVGRWYPTLESGVNLTQSAYSDNWNGGDKGSIVWSFITNAGLESQLNERTNWTNQLKLAYGQTHQQARDDAGERVWEEPEKSTDLIDYETVFRFTMGWVVDPYVSGRFESQFHDASDPEGRSLLLNPLKFKESAGLAKKIIAEEERELLTRVGFTFRQNLHDFYVNPAPDDATESETTHDGGFEWVTDWKTKILEEKVSWTSKLSLYQPVFYSDKPTFEDDLTAAEIEAAGLPTDVANYTTTLDVDWENIFTTQITSYLSVNLYTRWIYDKYDNSVPPVLDENGDLKNPDEVSAAIRKGGQFKQTLSIGITYRFL
ncbi:MAG: DUF3078 domain-containing protein [Candidatus Eisenbacteria bacterium]|nr:DUF3078 domain-containing protein [Candidatus Eisenbacteria bacterium]